MKLLLAGHWRVPEMTDFFMAWTARTYMVAAFNILDFVEVQRVNQRVVEWSPLVHGAETARNHVVSYKFGRLVVTLKISVLLVLGLLPSFLVYQLEIIRQWILFLFFKVGVRWRIERVQNEC